MISKFRVRFVEPHKQQPLSGADDAVFRTPHMLDQPNRRRKSRLACLECKTRHLKCDETFPACLRCQQRGVPCRSALRSAQWQIEVPGLTIQSQPSIVSAYVDHRRLQYWMEKASQVMVVDPNINPFSFDILKYFETSQSLICAVQSLSVAHENFFGPSSCEKVWEEQGKAMSLIQKELQESGQLPRGSLLAVLLIGLCSAWMYRQPGNELGVQHLSGARALLDILLAESGSEEDPFVQLALATYLGWDHAVAFLLPPGDQIPLESEKIWQCIMKMRNQYNATLGYAVEIIYLLGKVGRYCRAIFDGGLRDVDTEASLEEQLLQFTPADKDIVSQLVNDSFRKHGLIMLYRAIEASWTSTFSSLPTLDGLSFDSNEFSLDNDAFALGSDGFSLGSDGPLFGDTFSFDDDSFSLEDDSFSLEADLFSFKSPFNPNDSTIKQYAKDIIQNINDIPTGSHGHSLLALPMFCAASELTQSDTAQRQDVRERFRNLFSLTRLPVHMCVADLLETLWSMADSGRRVFWLSYVLQNSVYFTLC